MVKTTHEESDDSVERVPVGSLKLPPVGTGGRRVILEAGPGSPGPIVTCKYCGVAVDASTPAAHWAREGQGKFWKMIPIERRRRLPGVRATSSPPIRTLP